MMGDLWAAIAVMTALSAGIFLLCRRAASGLTGRQRTGSIAFLLFMVIAFLVYARDCLLAALLLPWSNVMVYADWTPLFAAAMAGCAWYSVGEAPWQRALWLGPLALMALWLSFGHLFEGPPACRDRWDEGICRQTSPVTCAAAAAATLLRHRGIEATESEMARLCLTGKRGTLRLGVYRGLVLKTARTPWKIEIFYGNGKRLREAGSDPSLLFLGLRRGQRADPLYSREWGWTPGLQHSVVLFGFFGENRIEVGDPSYGMEQWSDEALDTLWDGVALRLVRR
ncbi:MAG: hypothetical protein RDV48_18935 [Candidatus Eremiobacteraeota bacterium]|nr:hypothetical protein [Candidatus Eremiobacteraeota bacterium]